MDQEPAPKPTHKSTMSPEQKPGNRIGRLFENLKRLKAKGSVPETENQPGEQITFPHGEIALDAFKKEFPGKPEKAAVMEQILNTFFEQEMANTAIFQDPEGAILPYTKINVTELARAIAGVSKPEAEQQDTQKHKRVFILPSFPALQNGHQFTFVEIAIKQAMKYIPSAVEDLKAGRTPQDIEIFTVGSPTNKKWGNVTEHYVDLLKRDAYRTLGGTFSKLAKAQLSQHPQELARTSILFSGQSEAASLASSSAQTMISEGIATQDAKQRTEGKPYVQVLMDAPVTLNPSKNRKWDVIRGFTFDAIHSSITSSHIRKSALGEAGFLEQVVPILKNRGIETHESPEQLALKTEAKNIVKDQMYTESMPIDANKIKVNIRRGTRDRTIPQRGFARLANRKIDSYPEGSSPIGKFLVKDNQLDILNNNRNGRVREAAVRGTHIFSVIFPKHEVQKWGNTVDRILRTA